MLRIVSLFVLLPVGLFAQVDLEYKYLEKREAVTIELVNGELAISSEIVEQGKFLNNSLLYLAQQSIPYDSFRKIGQIEAYTTDPVSGKQVVVDHYENKDQIQGILFYSDSKLKEFTFPAVKKDAVTTLKYTEVYSNDIPFSQAFVFGSYFPIDRAAFSVTFPKEVELGYSYVNAVDSSFAFTKTENKKSTTYTWTAENIEGYRLDEAKNESALYYLPHVIVYIKQIKTVAGEKPVLRDERDLYAWYASLMDRIDDANLDEVKKIAEGIATAHPTPSAKAAAIYNWVQDNISYVAFGDGFGGFVPRGAASVCQKKYGDCKDMAHVLYVMLNHVGVEAYHTWIGSREKPYAYKQNPTPLVDDHMITAAVLSGDTVFLDGTDSFVRYGYPSGFTQGKQAMIGISKDDFRLVRVPVVDAAMNHTEVKTTLRIDGLDVLANETRRISGLEKVAAISHYIYKKGTDSDEEYLNKRLALGNNKTIYENIKFGGLNNDTDWLSMTYDLTIQNYSKVIDDKLFINMNIDRTYANDKLEDGTKYSIKFEHAQQKTFETIFEIPAGYQVDELPERLTFNDPKFGFDISYKRMGNQIIQSKKLYVNTLTLTPADFVQWNEFIKNLVKAYKKSIVLQKGA